MFCETVRVSDGGYCGVDAINGQKTLQGSKIDFIGLANDMTAAHTIGLSETIFLKMVCATLVMTPLELVAGDRVSVKALQSLVSRAIRCADVLQVMAPYSRGFLWNLRGCRESDVEVPSSRRAYEDRRWTCVPVNVPLLHRHRTGEDGVLRAHRRASPFNSHTLLIRLA